MAWQGIIKARFLVLFIFPLVFIVAVVYAQPELVSSDQVKWTQVPELNDEYRDWTIYTRNIKSYETIYTTITNISTENLSFEWKTDKVDDVYIDLKFLINGNVHDFCKSTTDLTPIKPFIVKHDDEMKFKFWVRTNTEVNVWIAFPPQINRTFQQTHEAFSQTERIPIQETVMYKKILIESGDDLQEEINKSESYTELVLANAEHNINNEIIIQGKNNITITSDIRNSSEKVLIKFSDFCQHNMIKIYDSNHIKINNLNLANNNIKDGIKIRNSSRIEISNNIIKFACCGNGIILYSGYDNLVRNNEFHNTSNHCTNSAMSTDIAVLGAYNTYIVENNMNSINSNFAVCHYRIMNGRPLNTTIVINNLEDIIELRLGACSCRWIGAYFGDCYEEGTGRPCSAHPDNDPDPYVWNY